METATATRRLIVRDLQYNVVMEFDKPRDYVGVGGRRETPGDAIYGTYDTHEEAERGGQAMLEWEKEHPTVGKMWDPDNKGELTDHPKPVGYHINRWERTSYFEEATAVEDR